MGMLSNAVSRKASTSEEIWRDIYGGFRQSKAGKLITVENAVRLSAVFACARVRGNGVAQVPLVLKQKNGRNRVQAENHQLFNLIRLRPNRWQTSFQWRQMASWHIDICGNHYSYISRQGNRILELYPFTPDCVEKCDKGRGVFTYKVSTPEGECREFAAEDILHLSGPTWNGMLGLEMISMARETLGLSLAAEESTATLHKNGVNHAGVYSVEGSLDDDDHKQLTKWVEEHYSGPENAGKPLILDRQAKWAATQMTSKDAQSLETRQYQTEEICRFYNIMPIMIGAGDKAQTYASSEQNFLAHISHCLAPIWESWEQQLAVQLLTSREIDQGYYFDFEESAIIRGSIKDVTTVTLSKVNGGLITPNEGREDLGLNPMAGEEYDELREPANITGNAPGSEGDRSNEGNET